ncbi:MAG: nucleotidyltransferase domain-containing protein [Chloroflexi bacterium]|nr:nucleotidyltransferase domain-containing protein [Chloroflexota bacterium]
MVESCATKTRTARRWPLIGRRLPPDVSAALKDLKGALSRLYGERLRGVYLYGSYARGDYTADSDVDVLIVLEGPVRPGEEIGRYNDIVSDICLKYDLLISTLPVAEETFQKGPRSFFEPVRREAVLL